MRREVILEVLIVTIYERRNLKKSLFEKRNIGT